MCKILKLFFLPITSDEDQACLFDLSGLVSILNSTRYKDLPYFNLKYKTVNLDFILQNSTDQVVWAIFFGADITNQGPFFSTSFYPVMNS